MPPHAPEGTSSRRLWIGLLIFVSAVTLAPPAWGDRKDPTVAVDLELVIAVDVSTIMGPGHNNDQFKGFLERR